MVDGGDAAAKDANRKDSVLTDEMHVFLLQTIIKKGFCRVADLKKAYNKAIAKEKSVTHRALNEVMKDISLRFEHYLKWKLVQTDEKIFGVCTMRSPANDTVGSDENNRVTGILNLTLMFLFMAEKPNAKDQGVLYEELVEFLTYSLAKDKSGKISGENMASVKKLIAPNNKSHFVRRGWITYQKGTNENEEEVFRYQWGPNALSSVDPTKLVELFQRVTGASPNSVIEQAERALKLKQEQLQLCSNGIELTSRSKKATTSAD